MKIIKAHEPPCYVHRMTAEELKADKLRRQRIKKRFPWRYSKQALKDLDGHKIPKNTRKVGTTYGKT